MAIDPRTAEGVSKIAHLSRLALSSDEAAALGAHMGKILEWVDELSALDTDGVEPGLHDSAREVLRADEVGESLPVASALANAPKKTALGFSVPAVLAE